MKRFIYIQLVISLCIASNLSGQRKITYDEAISIALNESYTVHFYKEDMEATHYSYLYTKAQFKPYMDFSLFTPSWKEGVQEINQTDGLPVYNSNGSLQAGGDLSFMYVLPTGGNFDLSTKMYYENYRTTLSQQNNKKLDRNQFYSRFLVMSSLT